MNKPANDNTPPADYNTWFTLFQTGQVDVPTFLRICKERGWQPLGDKNER